MEAQMIFQPLLGRVLQSRVSGLQGAIELWPTDAGPSLEDLEDAIRECREHPAIARRLCRRLALILSENGVLSRVEYNSFRDSFLALLDGSLEIMRRILALADARTGQTGQRVEGAFELADAVTEMEQVVAEARQAWPPFSDEELQEARAAIARGDFLDIDEAFAQMKGITVKELHRRVKEHKTKRWEYGWE
jgi:hypothetical protein